MTETYSAYCQEGDWSYASDNEHETAQAADGHASTYLDHDVHVDLEVGVAPNRDITFLCQFHYLSEDDRD
jgi:hypothetical protein